ncbi:MAG: L,D-transpeptidase family protein [Xanthobacteraceae bacterium]
MEFGFTKFLLRRNGASRLRAFDVDKYIDFTRKQRLSCILGRGLIFCTTAKNKLSTRWESILAKTSRTSLVAVSRRRAAGAVRKALVAGVALLFVASLADTADAAPRQKRVVAGKKRDVPIKHPFGEAMPKGPLQLVVSIADQRVTLYSNGVRVAQAPVSTGVPRHPTPTGIFSVIQKNRWHRSNLYGSAPMWYMHRLTWSGIALHEGALPGRPASHGCIRLPQNFVSRLWQVSRLGVRVVVHRTDIAPQEFQHAALFDPKPKPADTGATASRPIGLRSTLDPGSEGRLIQVAEATTAPAVSMTATDATRRSAAARQPTTPASTGDVTGAGTTGPSAWSPATRQTTIAEPTPQANTTAVNDALVAPVAAERTIAPAAPTGDPPTGTTQSPGAAPAPASTVITTAAPAPAGIDKPAVDPDELMLPRPAPLRTRSAEPAKLNGQVAVFISRKEKRIFVRHAFMPLFDMPVEIEEPDRPLGTHLYTAMELIDNGSRMRWNLITIPRPTAEQTAAAASKNNSKNRNSRNKRQAAKPAPKVEAKLASDATQALDRVTIPREAIDRIGELLIPGSSLIISDQGLGRETGRYTEFIVETRR